MDPRFWGWQAPHEGLSTSRSYSDSMFRTESSTTHTQSCDRGRWLPQAKTSLVCLSAGESSAFIFHQVYIVIVGKRALQFVLLFTAFKEQQRQTPPMAFGTASRALSASTSHSANLWGIWCNACMEKMKKAWLQCRTAHYIACEAARLSKLYHINVMGVGGQPAKYMLADNKQTHLQQRVSEMFLLEWVPKGHELKNPSLL